MDISTYFAIKKELCEYNKGTCRNCILGISHNGKNMVCNRFEMEHTERAQHMLIKWKDSEVTKR